MKAAVVEIDFDSGKRIAGKRPRLHRLDDTDLDRPDEFPGNHAAGDHVVEDEVLIARPDSKPTVAVLPAAACLAHKAAFDDR